MSHRPRRLPAWLAAGLVVPLLAAAPAHRDDARPEAVTVRSGDARIEVLSDTLVRLEYAADGRFEDRPTFQAVDRTPTGPVHVNRRIADGWLEVSTPAMTLRYRVGSGPFTTDNTEVRVHAGSDTLAGHPSWPSRASTVPETGLPTLVPQPWPAPLPPDARRPQQQPDPDAIGGWYRGLDNQEGPVTLHDGLLSRRGWYLLDDSVSPVAVGDRFVVRDHDGTYQDGYLFGYGHDYARGLADLTHLVGPPPLLPEALFGNWFSRYHAYTASDYRDDLLPTFRSARVPLDVLMVDTDFKAPNQWDGWEWNRALFDDPAGFLDWAHREGLLVGFNIHPSITGSDPRFAEADRRAGGLTPAPVRCRIYTRDPSNDCYAFDLAKPGEVAAYWWLHAPFEWDGTDFWWLDWCCDDASVSLPGVAPDAWMNNLYASRRAGQDGRGFVLSRVGSSFQDYQQSFPGPWADVRSTIHFTGDAVSTWDMLGFEIRFTAAEGATGLPYVSHDIGGFHGPHLPDDLYVRWVQMGAFQPINRLHSSDGDRLPWDYGEPARSIAERFLRLRESLVPTLYTLAWQAHARGMPMVRAMPLAYPEADAAYTHDGQYLLGDDLLVAPVDQPGVPATKEVWFPPGYWRDIFTGEVHAGPSVETLSVPLDRMPVFQRAGGIVVRQPYMDHVGARPSSPLEVSVVAGADGRFDLYEDAGRGGGADAGAHALTPLRYDDATRTVTIGPASGRFPGQPVRRGWDVTVAGVAPPVTVSVNGRSLGRVPAGGSGEGWWVDGDTVHVRLRDRPTGAPLTVRLG